MNRLIPLAGSSRLRRSWTSSSMVMLRRTGMSQSCIEYSITTSAFRRLRDATNDREQSRAFQFLEPRAWRREVVGAREQRPQNRQAGSDTHDCDPEVQAIDVRPFCVRDPQTGRV